MALEQSGVGGPELKTINTQLKLLEACLPSDPFIIGWGFNLKADVTLFVEEEIGDLSFSLFHDVVMLMESITDGQIKKSEVMAGLYQAQHVGFDEDEATLIHFSSSLYHMVWMMSPWQSVSTLVKTSLVPSNVLGN